MISFKNIFLFSTVLVGINSQAAQEEPGAKKYAISQILEQLRNIPFLEKTEKELALHEALKNGFGHAGSQQIIIHSLSEIAGNCHGFSENLMRYLLENVATESTGIVKGDCWDHEKEDFDQALELIGKKQKEECAPCDLFKVFLTQQGALAQEVELQAKLKEEARAAEKQKINAGKIAAERQKLAEILE